MKRIFLAIKFSIYLILRSWATTIRNLLKWIITIKWESLKYAKPLTKAKHCLNLVSPLLSLRQECTPSSTIATIKMPCIWEESDHSKKRAGELCFTTTESLCLPLIIMTYFMAITYCLTTIASYQQSLTKIKLFRLRSGLKDFWCFWITINKNSFKEILSL